MVKIYSVILLILITISTEVRGQEINNFKNELGLRVGYNGGFFKDSNFSPLNYKQAGFTFGLYYHRKKRNNFRVQLDFSPSKIATSASELFYATHLAGALKVDYLFSENSENSAVNWQLGPQYKFNFNLVDFRNLFSFTAWFSHDFNVAGGLQYSISDKQKIRTNLAIPAFSLMIRPPYNGFDEALEANSKKPLKLITDGKWMSWGKYQALDFSLFYDYQLTKNFDFTIGYKFQYQKITDIHQLIFAQHQPVLGIKSKF